MVRRKITYKLYPNATQKVLFDAWTRLHCELYNAALQERRDAWRRAHVSVSYYDQQNQLPDVKVLRPEYTLLGSHALQETLRRLDRAFAAFFRRLEAGKKPGYPRFKSARRYKSFSYPDPAGWKLEAHKGRTARLYLRHIGWIPMRGQHRFSQITPNDLTIRRSNGDWFASITARVPEDACVRVRTDHRHRGFDLGLQHLVTFDNGDTVENPRWLRDTLHTVRTISREKARKHKGSCRWQRLSKRIARLHETIECRRRDSLHKLTTGMVTESALLATETLAPKNMSASAKGAVKHPGHHVAQKAGLNREIRSAGFGTIHQMLAYKAAEAGAHLHLADTPTLKPTQRCSACGFVHKKTLAEREHQCSNCGFTTSRDRNSAIVCLLDAYHSAPGTGAAARETPLSVAGSIPFPGKRNPLTRETITSTK